MSEDDFLTSLGSELPSERMWAAQWALDHFLPPTYQQLMVEALARERVPRIQTIMALALNQFDRTRADKAVDEVRASGEALVAVQILDELAGVIRHELQPAIGWVRFAANREVSEFDTSATNRAVEALRRRVDGLAELAAANRLPARRMLSLREAVAISLAPTFPESMFSVEPNDEASDEIMTDPGLLSLILSNALQNAAEACVDMPPGEASVLITTNIDQKMFWLTITNRFVGASFEYSSVSATGRSSKHGHRGLGTRIIELAAGRLGYDFELRASGATVTFSLRGERFA